MSDLEHVNVTVEDANATAKMLCELFGWEIRWEGASIHDGYSVHVGSKSSYLALYTPPSGLGEAAARFTKRAGLNHIGIVVDDLDAVEAKVMAHGYVTGNHADYEPGRRFYFDDENGLEIEVISYS
jgi:catechol 2,3-dioxygenase-like lactoylglutathione lyase family enzyme